MLIVNSSILYLKMIEKSRNDVDDDVYNNNHFTESENRIEIEALGGENKIVTLVYG